MKDKEIFDFGAHLKIARLNCGLTQAEAAKKLGVDKVTIGCYEQNQYFPRLELFKKICEEYRVSSDYLLGIKPKDDEMVYLSGLNVKEKEHILGLIECIKAAKNNTK